MSDESAYSHARAEINRLPCVFAQALLARHAVCELAVRTSAAAKPRVDCAQPLARTACAQMMSLLREKSAFALGTASPRKKETQQVMMKMQCGGLDGLKAVVDSNALAPDVHRLIRLAQEQHGDLAELPFSEIVKGIAAFKNP